MMKTKILFTAILLGALSASATEVDRVIVRQQWPWHDGIKVEYRLDSVAYPVDLSVRVFKGDREYAVPREALTGDLYGVTDGIGEFTIDPEQVFDQAVRIEALTVRVSATRSSDYMAEVLYKIFDLETGACTDVRRGDILGGKYGAYETDYSVFGQDFSTGLEDVLIWTDVTNNPAYKTTKLVMRKVNAKDRVWQSGDPADAAVVKVSKSPLCYVKLTYDYYISVFEMTMAQWVRLGFTAPTGRSDSQVSRPAPDDDTGPVNGMYYKQIVGNPTATEAYQYGVVSPSEKVSFPNNSYLRDVGKDSLAAVLWGRTGYEFTLPTMAEWEFACMGGNTTVLYSGKAQTESNTCELAWSGSNSGGRVHTVGELAPNAYGLYDMLGNVFERVLGVGEVNSGPRSGEAGTQASPYVDPVGKTSTSYKTSGGDHPRYMGGCWDPNPDLMGYWKDCRHSAKGPLWCEWFADRNYIGFRLVIPATADGRWAVHH